MAKNLKQRLSRVIFSFPSCSCKVPPFVLENPNPVVVSTESIEISDSSIVPPVPELSNSTAFQRKYPTVSSVSLGCNYRSKFDPVENNSDGEEGEAIKDGKYSSVNELRDLPLVNEALPSNFDDEQSPSRTIKEKKKKKKKKSNNHRRKSNGKIFESNSSSLFTSEEQDDIDENINYYDDDETEHLISSISISSNYSSDQDWSRLKPPRSRWKGKGKKKMLSNNCKTSTLSCSVEGKINESFAVVKRSEDPYRDFRDSMLEMILEKEMFEERDLQELLRCFLSLNSVDHYSVIVKAFSEIWDLLFCKFPRPCFA